MESLDGLLAPLSTLLGSIVGAPRGLRPLTVIGAVAFSVVANNHASAAPDAAHRLRDALDEIVRLIDRAEVVREEGDRP